MNFTNLTSCALLMIITVIDISLGQRKIIENDNIAVEQRQGVRLFALPAPGLRFKKQSNYQSPNVFQSPNNNIDNFVGHLLPLEPSGQMPTIQALDVACHPGRMSVNMQFDLPFNGVIYSKGFYDVSDCMYVYPNSDQSSVSFNLESDMCGMQYINTPGQPAFMEVVIIIQNEAGIQEIWDTARGLRCLFDGSGGIAKNRHTVSARLNVAMLEQQSVTFRSDAQASASMDIQIGRGPFAPSASGLVKIGELMSMVIAVDGPKSIDVLVRQCIAHDGTNDNTIDLTDEKGCVLKKKIIGSWQKKRESSKAKAPVLAFAHFQAFKFPDKMDVYIECEIDLCNGPCPVCAEDQSDHSGRRKRALPRQSLYQHPLPDFEAAVEAAERRTEQSTSPNDHSQSQIKNKTVEVENAGLRLARKLRVLSPEDISRYGEEFSSFTLVTKNGKNELGVGDICMSVASFAASLGAALIVLVASSALTAVLCVRVRAIPTMGSSFPPDSSFHAFSAVSGKPT